MKSSPLASGIAITMTMSFRIKGPQVHTSVFFGYPRIQLHLSVESLTRQTMPERWLRCDQLYLFHRHTERSPNINTTTEKTPPVIGGALKTNTPLTVADPMGQAIASSAGIFLFGLSRFVYLFLKFGHDLV